MANLIDRPRFTCTLGGALGTLKALPGTVVPLIHAAPGCGGNLGYTISLSAAYAGSGYASNQTVSSSCVTEKELIFGGEERLEEQIRSTLELMDGELYVVCTACMVEIVGDDVKNVVARFADAPAPVLALETGGFRGDSYAGYDLLLSLLAEQFVEPCRDKDPRCVNLLGVVPIMDIFWKRDLTILKNLLQELGLRVNTFFGEGETLDHLRRSSEASLNIVLSAVNGVKTAQCYRDVHGIDYIQTPFPIGDHATGEFLRTVGRALQVPESTIQSVIARHQKEYYAYLEKVVDLYTDCDFQRYAAVISDANYAPALSRYLADDIGWLPELVVITNQLTAEEQERLGPYFDHYCSGFRPHVYFDTDTSKVKGYLEQLFPPRPAGETYWPTFDPAFVIGSSLDRELAGEIGALHLSVSYPIANRMIVNRGYAGYEGGLNLLEDLFTQLVACR